MQLVYFNTNTQSQGTSIFIDRVIPWNLDIVAIYLVVLAAYPSLGGSVEIVARVVAM